MCFFLYVLKLTIYHSKLQFSITVLKPVRRCWTVLTHFWGNFSLFVQHFNERFSSKLCFCSLLSFSLSLSQGLNPVPSH